MSWPLTDDGEFYIFDGQVLMPVDPTSSSPILMLRPQGGMGVGIPAIESGAPGKHAEIDNAIDFTPLDPDDPTPDSASWSTVTPPDDATPGVYRLSLSLHTGKDGADGTTTLTLAGVGGTSTAKKTIIVNNANNGFIFASQKVGDWLYPASISNTASGQGSNTLCKIVVAANQFDFDWRPMVVGHTIITGTGTNVRVDLVARLNGETSGNVIARCHGLTSLERLQFTPAPPAGSSDGFNKVSAFSAATIYIRTEQQSGSDSYTTVATTSLFGVRVCETP